jgi:hypothetical protein
LLGCSGTRCQLGFEWIVSYTFYMSAIFLDASRLGRRNMVGDIDFSGNSGCPGSGGNSQPMIAIRGGDYSLRSPRGREGENLVAGSAKLE